MPPPGGGTGEHFVTAWRRIEMTSETEQYFVPWLLLFLRGHSLIYVLYLEDSYLRKELKTYRKASIAH